MENETAYVEVIHCASDEVLEFMSKEDWYLYCAAPDLLTALERAITALNTAPSFGIPALCDEMTPRMTSYKLLAELERVVKAAKGAA